MMPVVSVLATKRVILDPNRTILGVFKITFSAYSCAEPKCTETDLKKYQICPIWGQFCPSMTPLDVRITTSIRQ